MVSAVLLPEEILSIRDVQERFSTQKRSALTSAFAVSISLRMSATRATFAGFPASTISSSGGNALSVNGCRADALFALAWMAYGIATGLRPQSSVTGGGLLANHEKRPDDHHITLFSLSHPRLQADGIGPDEADPPCAEVALPPDPTVAPPVGLQPRDDPCGQAPGIRARQDLLSLGTVVRGRALQAPTHAASRNRHVRPTVYVGARWRRC